MKMIRLDNGTLLNLSAVSYISNTEKVAYFKQPVIKNTDSFQTEKCFGVGVLNELQRVPLTEAHGSLRKQENREIGGDRT